MSDPRWLLLIHQIPPKPDYFRVKVRRRLHRLGAYPLKNSVYALPNTEESLEDFLWLAQEIRSEGGEAIVVEGDVIAGLPDDELEAMVQATREAAGQ
ncbi:MAG TPA: Chromate resistance protein ChrB, partial [Gemmatimonadales bacterium]|nr:Chromate resistance protein ChrB [Gemmatimonadales bacterium]